MAYVNERYGIHIVTAVSSFILLCTCISFDTYPTIAQIAPPSPLPLEIDCMYYKYDYIFNLVY